MWLQLAALGRAKKIVSENGLGRAEMMMGQPGLINFVLCRSFTPTQLLTLSPLGREFATSAFSNAERRTSWIIAVCNVASLDFINKPSATGSGAAL